MHRFSSFQSTDEHMPSFLLLYIKTPIIAARAKVSPTGNIWFYYAFSFLQVYQIFFLDLLAQDFPLQSKQGSLPFGHRGCLACRPFHFPHGLPVPKARGSCSRRNRECMDLRAAAAVAVYWPAAPRSPTCVKCTGGS